jgi:hypothetical protein
MLARHIKPKKIVFHSRLLPHETCGMNRRKNPLKIPNFAAKGSPTFDKRVSFPAGLPST